ncbi:MAG: mycofactocin system glycosyltransferase [Proteobacteria bacterium]|nr:mycofactocin system glycosyltransferase [Pseudomonadota bacterium]
MENRSDTTKPLAYRLRKSVRLKERANSPVLVLDYPLKATVLDPSWTPALECMSEGSYVPLERTMSLLDTANSDDVGGFLDDLVRKGFLEREGIRQLSEHPSVSIIIPIRNRPDEIRACLGSLEQLDYPGDKLEIIVVDDASIDHTPEVVKEFPVDLIQLEENRQASYCRNLAARKASGEVLAFIDSDCTASPSWLRELLPAFRDPSVGAVGGLVDSGFDEKALDRYEKAKSSLNMGKRFMRTQKNDRFFYVPSCNLLVRKTVFFELGGFNEDLTVGEDVDFCWRMQDAGRVLEYQPLGRVYHKHRNRLGDFCRRRFDYGGSEPLLHKLHPARSKELYFPPLKTFFWVAVCMALIIGSLPVFQLGLVLLGLDGLMKFSRTRQSGIDFGISAPLRSALREQATFLFHNCAFLSRYYLFLTVLLLPVFPLISFVGLCAHLLTTLVEFRIHRPTLNPPSFLFYFTLEQLFYQLGVWRGCLKHRTFNPVFPGLVARKPKRTE